MSHEGDSTTSLMSHRHILSTSNGPRLHRDLCNTAPSTIMNSSVGIILPVLTYTVPAITGVTRQAGGAGERQLQASAAALDL